VTGVRSPDAHPDIGRIVIAVTKPKAAHAYSVTLSRERLGEGISEIMVSSL